MKVVFSSYKNPDFITITEYMENALKEFCEPVFFNNRAYIIPGMIRARLPSAEHMDLLRINSNLLSFINKIKPEIFLEAGGHRIFPETLIAIKKKGIMTVLWTSDILRKSDKNIYESAPYYDLVFNGGTEAKEMLLNYRKKDIYWLPFACDPNYQHPVELSPADQKEYESDIVFVGSFYPNRMRVLESISALGLKIWGPGWENVPKSSPLRKCIKNTSGIKQEDWIKIYSGCKIAITVHYQDGITPCYQASPKVYETLACRCFLLVNAQKDVLSLFRDGEHLAVFNDTAGLKEKIKYYLDNTNKRKQIAAAGYKEVLAKHTYFHRVKEMFEVIKNRS